jgi:hypothetical protein
MRVKTIGIEEVFSKPDVMIPRPPLLHHISRWFGTLAEHLEATLVISRQSCPKARVYSDRDLHPLPTTPLIRIEARDWLMLGISPSNRMLPFGLTSERFTGLRHVLLSTLRALGSISMFVLSQCLCASMLWVDP